MGRPLNKKYFGNRNIGTTGTGDNKIGGEGIASITWSTLGSFMGNSNVQVLTAIPALPAPTLPGGVQATWTMQFEVESVTTGAGKTNLAVGDTFSYAGVPGLIAKVTDLSGANAIFSVTTTGASRGNALALADIPQDTQTVSMTQTGGTGTAGTFTVDILFRVKASTVTITEKGSGYVGTETFTFAKPGTSVGTVPAGTIVLTTDSGAAGSATNQENAIKVYAKTTSGGSRKVGDIIKQVNDTTYKVKTADGTYQKCFLRTDGGNGVGTCDITAYDSDGGEYWVKKLTARKAVLVVKGSGGGSQFATGKAAKWVFRALTSDDAGNTVKIDNA